MSTLVTLAPSSDLDDFVALSAILTGIAADQLKPFLDTYNTAQTYLNLAKSKALTQFTALMSVYEANKTQPPQQVGQIILGNSNPDVVNMAKSIMLLWYLACWYEPSVLPALQKNSDAFLPFTVVSSNAYTQSWVWRVGQTHPMGYSEWRFGYWHTSPPALSSFIGGDS